MCKIGAPDVLLEAFLQVSRYVGAKLLGGHRLLEVYGPRSSPSSSRWRPLAARLPLGRPCKPRCDFLQTAFNLASNSFSVDNLCGIRSQVIR